MLKIKEILSLFFTLLIFSLFSLSFKTLAHNHTPHQEKLITQVELLFKKNVDNLDYNKVIKLSSQIINQRSHYPSETVAKTYLLLSYVANNKGELETALQFNNDGLTIPNQNLETKLKLQIHLAKILLAKKKYQRLLTTVQEVINTPENKQNTSDFLIALSYRSVAFSMTGEHTNALIDLLQVEKVVQATPAFSEHISLLTILANAYYYLGDYQTALTVQLKVLKLRFNSNKLSNIHQTYFYIANAYYRLNKLDDAYTAYWEAKNHALKKDAPIYVAYASQGLALTLLRQKQYDAAEDEALQAKELFYLHNLTTPHLETIIILTEIYNTIKKEEQSFTQLLQAENLLANLNVTSNYIVVYQYLANMYFVKQDLDKALYWQNKYSEILLKNIQLSNEEKRFDNSFVNKAINQYNKDESFPDSTKARELTINLAEQSELTSSFSDKFHNQQLLILILTVTTIILLILIVILLIKQRRNRLLSEYEALENPSYILANSIQTKQLYQTSFNMARKYNYPLTLGYISITNWQELTFQFNKKTVLEVSRGIAHLINEQLIEFETSGLINDGEYLLFFPHQNKENVIQTIEKLVSALKLRFFANLGEFSIIIAYSIDSPDFQDIDPYIFLSQLSDSIKLA
jgi:tetratricopeptide (TPR) repeat protein/GGDEF domain-containing protein